MKALRTVGFILFFIIGVSLVSNEILDPYMSKWVMSWEMSKGGYAVVTKEYEKLSPCGRMKVRKLMGKGYLAKDDMPKFFSIALGEKEKGATIQTYPAPDYLDANESIGSELWRNLTHTPTESNAKTKLFEMASEDSTAKDTKDICQ